jgi:hypothetical protein
MPSLKNKANPMRGRKTSGKSVTPFEGDDGSPGGAKDGCAVAYGMAASLYGFMAFTSLYCFQHVSGEVDSVEFWFMMPVAMLCSFLTSYPVNWWLVRSGIEEIM